MRLKSKRLISLLLAGSMMVSMLPASAVTAFAEEAKSVAVMAADNVENGTVVAEGNCGVTGHESDVTWKIVRNNTDDSNPTYTLILSASESGQGVMADYANKAAVPYSNYLDNITIGVVEKGVKHLGARAFILAPKLSSVELPEGLLSIGESCFNCSKLDTGLESIQFPSTLKEIGKNAFYQGKLKGAVQIPESVETIGYGAFTQCKDMTSVNLPKNLKVLGQGAFNDCGLTQMPEIPVAITTLNTTFKGCGNITEITIPSQVTDITRAFQNTGIKTVTIPCTVENYDAAFTDCKSLESVIIESSSDKIGDKIQSRGSGVFQGCTNLKSVTVPSWVTSIGGFAFADCTSLTNPTFLRQIKDIGAFAFSNSGITGSLVLTATQINECAFDKCTNLGPDICLANQATIGESAFRNCSNLNGIQYVQQSQYVHTFPNCTSKAVLNGGTIADNTAFKSGKLATPTKDGYRFEGWYTSENFADGTQVESDATPEANQTYYAKWYEYNAKVDAEEKADGTTANYVGSPVDIAVNVTAEDVDVSSIRKADLIFDDINAVEKVEVNGKTLDKPYTNIDLDSLNNSNAEQDIATMAMVPVTTEPVILHVTFNKPGEHKMKIVLKDNLNNVVCASKDTTVTVKGKPIDWTPIEKGYYQLTLTDCSATLDDGTEVKSGESAYVQADKTVTLKLTASMDNMKFNGFVLDPQQDSLKYIDDTTATFTMPSEPVSVTVNLQPEESDDSLDAATVVTGVVLGTGTAILAYHIGTEVYAEQVLGKGVAIPRTREEVALKAWELAGKPAVELNGEPLSEAAQAEKWAVESGLMQNVDGSFNGSKKMSKLKALRTLDAAKKLG